MKKAILAVNEQDGLDCIKNSGLKRSEYVIHTIENPHTMDKCKYKQNDVLVTNEAEKYFIFSIKVHDMLKK